MRCITDSTRELARRLVTAAVRQLSVDFVAAVGAPLPAIIADSARTLWTMAAFCVAGIAVAAKKRSRLLG
jgi:hypothetical protein